MTRTAITERIYKYARIYRLNKPNYIVLVVMEEYIPLFHCSEIFMIYFIVLPTHFLYDISIKLLSGS